MRHGSIGIVFGVEEMHFILGLGTTTISSVEEVQLLYYVGINTISCVNKSHYLIPGD
jgi:hypothetical protein